MYQIELRFPLEMVSYHDISGLDLKLYPYQDQILFGNEQISPCNDPYGQNVMLNASDGRLCVNAMQIKFILR